MRLFIGDDTSRLIAGEQVGGSAPSSLLLIVGVGKRLPVVVADDKASTIVFDVPRRREAASLYRHGTPSSWSTIRLAVETSAISC
jgi:hypothetical protein